MRSRPPINRKRRKKKWQMLEKEAEKWQSARFLFVRYFRLVVLVFSYSINASKIISLCSTQCEKKRNRRRQRRLIGIIIPGRLIELKPAVPVFIFSCSTILFYFWFLRILICDLYIFLSFSFLASFLYRDCAVTGSLDSWQAKLYTRQSADVRFSPSIIYTHTGELLRRRLSAVVCFGSVC